MKWGTGQSNLVRAYVNIKKSVKRSHCGYSRSNSFERACPSNRKSNIFVAILHRRNVCTNLYNHVLLGCWSEPFLFGNSVDIFNWGRSFVWAWTENDVSASVFSFVFSFLRACDIHPFSGCQKRYPCVNNTSLIVLCCFFPFLFLNWELVHSKLKTWICTYISVGFLISSTLFEFRMVLHWWLCSLSTAPDNALWVFLYEGCFIFDCFSCWVITINNSDSWKSCQIPKALVLPRRKCQKVSDLWRYYATFSGSFFSEYMCDNDFSGSLQSQQFLQWYMQSWNISEISV